MVKNDDAWWVSTRDFLPNSTDDILIISKFGHVTRSRYKAFFEGDKKLFRPDGLEPGKDVKWWMMIPKDGWNSIKDLTPPNGTECLTMGHYGEVYNGVWKGNRFIPFVFEVLYWRDMPLLPDGVTLNY